ncbi:ABC transporter substrate-binding protein [Parachlamydia sp. AcF125]|uniref:ABC transporter substrate-binding protein n=1 Tax=Parachlamydia sp. AcF125 TaxID=2795736 RepID=UPI001BCA3C15|nr:ABC transporter substrate-binding protein [Parachlamydia sp. AcF125]MBS4168928.1 putative thiamine biosynthesis protein [Parachlamydia sp. AcF125]
MAKKTWVPFIAFCFLIGSWEFCSRFFSELLFVLPPPSRILLCTWQKSDRLLFHTGITLKEMGGGFLLALLVAFPLAWMMAFWESMRMILQPLFIIIQCIPMFALAPLMVMWFGWSYTAIVLPTALMIFFPLTMNIYQGLLSTPQHLTDYFKTLKATPWQFFFKLQLPSSLPHIFAGFRISAAIAGIAAIAGEWAGAQEGLGILMLQSRRETDLEITFGALFCLTFISLALYLGMTAVEKAVKNRKTWRLSVNGVAAAALITIVFGCQPSPKEKETKLLLDWVPNPNHVALYVGIDKGFFKKKGIDLQILKLHDPSDAVGYLMSGQADLAVYYTTEALQAMQKGAKLSMVGVLIQEPLNSLLYHKEGGIHALEDLNGKVIGFSMNGMNFKSLQVLLKQRHIAPQAMHNVSFDLVSALAAKRVDAVYDAYWNIEVPHLRSLGIETDFFTMNDLGIPPYQELILIAKEGSLQASPEFVEKLQAAMQETIVYCQKNPDEAFDIYLKANPDKGDKAREWEREAWKLTYPILAQSQKIDQTEVNNYRDWLLEHNILQR